MTSPPSTTTCVSCTWISCLLRLLFAASVPPRESPAASVTTGWTSAAMLVSVSLDPNENMPLFANAREAMTSANATVPVPSAWKKKYVSGSMLGACTKRAPRIAQMYAFPLVSTPPVGSTSP